MDIETAKILVGTALIVAVSAFSLVTLSSAAVEMLRDLHILPWGSDRDTGRSSR